MLNLIIWKQTPVRHFSASASHSRANLEHPLVWKVDWDRVQSGEYAIVDPIVPTEILYLTKKEYLKLIGVTESNDERPLVVIAVPGTPRPSDKDIKAPAPDKISPHYGAGSTWWRQMRSKIARSYGTMLSPTSRSLGGKKIIKIFSNLWRRWALCLAQWTSLPRSTQGWLSDLNIVIPKLTLILRHQGPSGLVRVLKNSSLLITQFLAGTPQKSNSFGHPVKLSRCGLPLWIPLPARHAIRQGSKRTIRFWLSLLSIYKIIEVPYKVSTALRTIQTPRLELTESVKKLLKEYENFLKNVYVPHLLRVSHTKYGPEKARPIPKFEPEFFCPVSAGPNTSPAIDGVEADAEAWADEARQNSSLYQAIVHLMEKFQVYGMIYEPLNKLFFQPFVKPIEGRSVTIEKVGKPWTLSRLFLLPEPAGKIRVVAIVDIFTQRILKILHKDLFQILRFIPMDGTWDQNKCFKYLKDIRGKFPKLHWSSLDISAATDTIPRELYTILLTILYKDEQLAQSVLTLLADRDFTVSSDGKTLILDDSIKRSSVRYGRGQPMGALSSFALLGLWNHSWVQFASYRVTGKLTTTYGVTGDDVVIAEENANTPIGKEYINLCSMVGIPISLAKSYCSNILFNFLSRTFFDTEEVSPASIKEEFSIQDSASRLMRSLRLKDRDWWKSSENGWLVQAVKTFLYPSEYIPFTAALRCGKFTGIGVRALISFLAPSTLKSKVLGLQGGSLFTMISVLAGITSVMTQGVAALTGQVRKIQESEREAVMQEAFDLLTAEVQDRIINNALKLKNYSKWCLTQASYLQNEVARALFLPLSFGGYIESLQKGVDIHDVENSHNYLLLLHHALVEFGKSFNRPDKAFAWPEKIQFLIFWLDLIPPVPDFNNPALFSYLSEAFYTDKLRGKNLMTESERKSMSIMMTAALKSPDIMPMNLPIDMANSMSESILKRLGILC